jgi:putative PIN family toxin of toxin-antitoxin system
LGTVAGEVDGASKAGPKVLTSSRGRHAAKPRAVIDTNVVLSALVFSGGVTARLRRRWQQGDFIALTSTATAQELVRVLAYPKFGLDLEGRDELLADYLPYTEVVPIPTPPPPVPTCRDPADLPFLILAVAGAADFLVTGDADLKALSEKVAFSILRPASFDAVLSSR